LGIYGTLIYKKPTLDTIEITQQQIKIA
jgi:hypothetical protein